MKKISAIITTYKRNPALINRAVKSIKSNKYIGEIILIDDNEMNSEFSILIQKEIDLRNIRYYKNESNKGVQYSRNIGILISRYDYIAFLDDDDEWLPNKTELQLKKFSADVGLVYCNGFLIEPNGEKRIYNNNHFKEVTFDNLLYGDFIGTTSQAIIRKDVFAKVGLFDLNQPARQDYELWIRISRFYRCVCVDEMLFNHYIHDNDQISKSSKKSYVGYRNIYNKYKKYFQKSIISKCRITFRLIRLSMKNKRILSLFKYLIIFMFSFSIALVSEPRKIIKEVVKIGK